MLKFSFVAGFQLFNSTTDAHNKPDAAEAEPFLKPGGKIMLEFGDGQADAVRKIFETEKWMSKR